MQHEGIAADYCGNILYGNYSTTLKKRVEVCIAALCAFEKVGNPAITYISAWREGENKIWYEFAGRLFVEVLGCKVADLAQVFRNCLIDRRVYKNNLEFDPKITQEIIDNKDLGQVRDRLREEVKRAGIIEAVYKVQVPNGGIIWLKDQANLEVYKEDGICLSQGCLTIVTKEMEAEENLKRVEDELRRVNQKLERLATLDGLTQVANRHRFDEWLNQVWEYLKREQKPLSLIICDVDHFKFYNDTYGHQAGDQCLQAIAHIIDANVKRAVDLVARYGGEEFAVILSNTDSQQAVYVAGLISNGVRQLNIRHGQSVAGSQVTLSLGVASIVPRQGLSPHVLIEAADKALYEAKGQGRDRIVLSGSCRVLSE